MGLIEYPSFFVLNRELNVNKIILHRIGRSQSDNRSHDILSLVSSVLTQQRPYLSTIFQKVHTLSSLIHFIPRYMGCLVSKLIGNQLSDG